MYTYKLDNIIFNTYIFFNVVALEGHTLAIYDHPSYFV